MTVAPEERPDLRSPTLRERWRELRDAGDRARELAGPLDAEEMRWAPGPGRWSVAECLDHLVRTGEAYLPRLDDAIAGGRREGRTGEEPFRRTLLGRWIPGMVEPPPGLRVPAPARIRPRTTEVGAADEGRSGGPPGPATALPRFLSLRGRLGRRLEAADGLDLGRVRVSSPFLPFLRLDLDSTFRFLAAHERRHLWQAERVRESEGFPSP